MFDAYPLTGFGVVGPPVEPGPAGSIVDRGGKKRWKEPPERRFGRRVKKGNARL